MNILKSAVLAFSSFSKIPMPHVEWREDNMRYMMCFFPAVGLAIGIVLAAWAWLAAALGAGPVLTGAGLALLPVAVTGGIHLDGFCDVVDAQSSHASPARKREILKDPHLGAFAAIGVAAYLIAYTALAGELASAIASGSATGWRVVALLCGMHVASRCLSGIATVSFPTSSSQGMLSMFHESGQGASKLAVLAAELAVCAVLMMLVNVAAALAMLVVGLACLVALHPFARTQFGGMSGDVAGFFLQVAELAMLVALVVVSKVVLL